MGPRQVATLRELPPLEPEDMTGSSLGSGSVEAVANLAVVQADDLSVSDNYENGTSLNTAAPPEGLGLVALGLAQPASEQAISLPVNRLARSAKLTSLATCQHPSLTKLGDVRVLDVEDDRQQTPERSSLAIELPSFGEITAEEWARLARTLGGHRGRS